VVKRVIGVFTGREGRARWSTLEHRMLNVTMLFYEVPEILLSVCDELSWKYLGSFHGVFNIRPAAHG